MTITWSNQNDFHNVSTTRKKSWTALTLAFPDLTKNFDSTPRNPFRTSCPATDVLQKGKKTSEILNSETLPQSCACNSPAELQQLRAVSHQVKSKTGMCFTDQPKRVDLWSEDLLPGLLNPACFKATTRHLLLKQWVLLSSSNRGILHLQKHQKTICNRSFNHEFTKVFLTIKSTIYLLPLTSWDNLDKTISEKHKPWKAWTAIHTLKMTSLLNGPIIVNIMFTGRTFRQSFKIMIIVQMPVC